MWTWDFAFFIGGLFTNSIIQTSMHGACYTAHGVIGNIAFPSSSKKGKLISPPLPEYKFTQKPPVAQRLPTKDVTNVFPRLSHPSPIELIFG